MVDLLKWAENSLRTLGKGEDQVERVIEEMKSSDYENMIGVADRISLEVRRKELGGINTRK